MNIEINLVNQINDETCMSACLAMLTGIPIEQVIKEFHADYFRGKVTAYEYLKQKGIGSRKFWVEERGLSWGCLYLLAVPSLNKKGILHSILAQTTSDGLQIFDPQQGRYGKDYYTYGERVQAFHSHACELKGYVIELEIISILKKGF